MMENFRFLRGGERGRGGEEEQAEQAARTFGAKRHHVGHKRLLEKEKNLDACIVAVAPPDYYEVLKDVLSEGLPMPALTCRIL